MGLPSKAIATGMNRGLAFVFLMPTVYTNKGWLLVLSRRKTVVWKRNIGLWCTTASTWSRLYPVSWEPRLRLQLLSDPIKDAHFLTNLFQVS
jgi:hypothetical protein